MNKALGEANSGGQKTVLKAVKGKSKGKHAILDIEKALKPLWFKAFLMAAGEGFELLRACKWV